MSGPDKWSFHNPVAVSFGAECWLGAGEGGAERNLLLLTTPGTVRRGVAARVGKDWGGEAKITVCDRVSPNPELVALETIRRDLEREEFDGVIAVGGGSVIDSAKVLSVLLANRAMDLRTELEAGAPLPSGAAALPIHALPTTAGSGSEVTPFATVWESASGRKYSLASPALFPRTAHLDPELTAELPRELAVATGLDALSQALESIWNRHANPVTLALATESLRLAIGTLPALGAGGRFDAAQRGAQMLASLLAGLAISHTRTALAHAMSYPLTAHYGLPHGLACSFTLPALLDFNAVADDGRLAAAAKAAGCVSIARLREKLLELLAAVGADDLLRRHRIDGERLARLAPEMLDPGRSGNNLRSATLADVQSILHAVGSYLPGCRLLALHGA